MIWMMLIWWALFVFFQMSGDKKHQLDDKFVLDLFFSIDCLLRGIHFYQFFFGGVFGISPYN